MRVLDSRELEWIAGGYDSVEEITVTPPSDDGGNDDGWDDGWGHWDDPGDTGSGWGEDGGGSGGGGGGPSVNVDVDVVELIKLLKDLKWAKAGILGNEVKMKIVGGYDGEQIDPNKLSKVGSVEGITVYSYPVGDLGDSKVYYADRDGNGSVDTGVVFVPENNLVGWDYNTDGHIDEIVTD